MVSNTVEVYFEVQIPPKIFKLKSKDLPINAGLYMTFKHCISISTYLAANFGCD